MNFFDTKDGLQRLAMIVAFSIVQFSANAVQAQESENEYSGDYPGDTLATGTSSNTYGIVLSLSANPAATGSITNAIKNSYDFCARMRRPEYLVDCLGVQLEQISKSMTRAGDYGEARKILEDASQKLRRLAAANRAPDKPLARATGKINRKSVTTAPLTPVMRDRIKQVNQEAAKILEEAETKLLRSAASSDRRLIAYAQMAKAVGSNKTLLRSA